MNRISGILFTVAVQCHLFKLGLFPVRSCEGHRGWTHHPSGGICLKGHPLTRALWCQLRTELHSGDLQPGSVGESAQLSFTSYMLETRLPPKTVFCLVTYLSAVNLWLQVIHPKSQGKDRDIFSLFNISFHEASEFSVYVFLLICCASFLARICLQI